MNELELLNRLRDEVPARPDVRAEERRLLAEIRGGSPVPRKRPALRPRWGLALVACGVAAAAVVVSQLGGAERPVKVRPADPVGLLENAALVAARTKAVEIRSDQWFYIKESQHMPGGGGLPGFEHWSRMDGQKDAVRTRGKLRLGNGEKGPTNPGKTAQEVEALPTDPDQLLAHFRGLKEERTPLSICQPNCPEGTLPDVNAFGAIGWYLKFGPVIPPEKAAAMYRALAKIPNVTVQENVSDGDGRQGIGVVLDLGAAGKGTYILDPEDYHYMGIKVEQDGETASMSVLGSGIVDQPGQTP
ncbi:CU044_5270 family protein [Nonomuraea sp. NPDC049269]|uniref:CU044_5270 family protein n=1 Tax=Nonomuraea sp. NPDC049269 TaxID=3364349 RepID=UPI00371F84B7